MIETGLFYRNLESEIRQSEELLVANWDELSTDEQAEVFVHMKGCLEKLKDFNEMMTSKLGPQLHTPLAVEGQTLEAKWGSSNTKWDTQNLRSIVPERMMAQAIDEDGVLSVPVSVLLQQIFDYFGVGYWKVGELKKLGLDPDDYRERSGGRVRIEVH